MACKVAPALAAGCTMVLKPSELAPSAVILAEILDDAGVPPGVFNLVKGDEASARRSRPIRTWTWCPSPARPAPASWMHEAADTVKKVALELGGKSANILLDDADFPAR
jgi:aldehyde dehydrogenase (NAD+)